MTVPYSASRGQPMRGKRVGQAETAGDSHSDSWPHIIVSRANTPTAVMATATNPAQAKRYYQQKANDQYYALFFLLIFNATA